MKKLILLIVLITNFCIFNVSYSEPGNTHTGQDVITAGMPTMGQIKYCINQPSASKCPPGNDGKNINSGYIDCTSKRKESKSSSQKRNIRKLEN